MTTELQNANWETCMIWPSYIEIYNVYGYWEERVICSCWEREIKVRGCFRARVPVRISHYIFTTTNVIPKSWSALSHWKKVMYVQSKVPRCRGVTVPLTILDRIQASTSDKKYVTGLEGAYECEINMITDHVCEFSLSFTLQAQLKIQSRK